MQHMPVPGGSQRGRETQDAIPDSCDKMHGDTPAAAAVAATGAGGRKGVGEGGREAPVSAGKHCDKERGGGKHSALGPAELPCPCPPVLLQPHTGAVKGHQGPQKRGIVPRECPRMSQSYVISVTHRGVQGTSGFQAPLDRTARRPWGKEYRT
ncbi:hypothetical protein NDU88_003522 [Pleurodeles waltl]|uniref:Uncharacterized protein n=1 Tax=Pleurodeles waltl TaxID=8319 RepID=A0AAV7UZ58_PLEWA|nr:hypothetical protein NDU88_003522 [Pleurodeles waltl]